MYADRIYAVCADFEKRNDEIAQDMSVVTNWYVANCIAK